MYFKEDCYVVFVKGVYFEEVLVGFVLEGGKVCCYVCCWVCYFGIGFEV